MYQNIIALVKDYLETGEKASNADLIDFMYTANKIYDYCTNKEEAFLAILIMQKIEEDYENRKTDISLSRNTK